MMLANRILGSWIYICIGLNALVFFMWQMMPRLFMFKNFAASWTSLIENRYWVLLTSVFSHSEMWHLMINMFVLHSFGTLLEQVMGRSAFWGFYLIAGLVGSLSHALVSKFFMGQASLPAVGASGAIAGLILIFALQFPKEKILFFGVVPVPALVGALMFVGMDLWGLFAQSKGGGFAIGHGAHLGGALAGAIYFFLRMR